MIRVLFFASLREQLDCECRELAPDAVATVAELRETLCAEGGARWREQLGADNIICTVNQVVCDDDHPVADGDEVAFFPPVTGG